MLKPPHPPIPFAPFLSLKRNQAAGTDSPSTLGLVSRLSQVLADEGIEYCHWKSNTFLDRTACGDNDLDLLVRRAHTQRFMEILQQLDFKETRLPASEELPGVRNFYGFDHPSGRLIHVHAHFQLILGNDLSKNYHLPVERAYLASAAQGTLLRLPAREFELLVFVIRMTLKHSTWDALLMRHGQLSSSERDELADLADAPTLTRIDPILRHIPNLDRALFDLCLRSLQPGCPVGLRIRAGERLQRILRACARRLHVSDVLLKFWHRLSQPIQRRAFHRVPKNRFASGGLFIAIVGGDGAGKTTVLDGLNEWLAGKFEVRRVHMGKPVWSQMTTLVRGLLKVGTILRLYRFEGDTYEESFQPHGLPWFLRTVCTARDRALTYLRARRFSMNGGLVLCDRYSLAGFLQMDGPQCGQALSNLEHPSRLHEFLAEREAAYYRSIQPPDLLIVLKLDPETAVQRKADETAASVRARSSEVWRLDWEKISGFEVDASGSREQTLARVQALIWEHL